MLSFEDVKMYILIAIINWRFEYIYTVGVADGYFLLKLLLSNKDGIHDRNLKFCFCFLLSFF